jgi:MoxR-like ATPase
VVVDYLPEDDEVAVVLRTTAAAGPPIQPVLTGEDILHIQQLVRSVPVAEDVVRYAVRLAAASRPHQTGTPGFINEFVGWGAGLRAAQFLVLGGKARALLEGRTHVTPDDIRRLALPTLRHRILTNYRADAANLGVDELIRRLLETVPGVAG